MCLDWIVKAKAIGFCRSAALPAAFFIVGCALEPGIEQTSRALASAVTVTFQDGASGYAGTTDTQIRQASASASYGAATSINVDGDEPSGTGQDVSGLFRWNVSAIPPGSAIQAVSLTFRVTNTTANTYPIFAMARSWAEASATWQQASAGTPWQATGAQGTADRESTVLGSLAAPPVGSHTAILNAAGIAEVKKWVDSPGQNFGLVIAHAGNGDGVDVASSENPVIASRPKLTVTYALPELLDASTDLGSDPQGGGGSGGGSGGTGAGGSGTGGSGTGGSGTGGSDTGGSGPGGSSGGGGGAGSVPVVLYAAGDIGDCATVTDDATSLLLDGSTGPIAILGDIAYPSGSATNFSSCFAPAWGRHKVRMRPSPGNHEYQTAGAAGYFGYFGTVAGDPSQGYYSYDLGAWHIVALNSGRCSTSSRCISSTQVNWLRADLAANPRLCTLAYWHHPRFSSGSHGDSPRVAALWTELMNAGADVVLSGHDHNYQRWVPQNPSGQAVADGIVEFVVGTGGTTLTAFTQTRANNIARSSSAHGVLKLTLRDAGYDWQFIPVAGQTFTDSGSANCH